MLHIFLVIVKIIGIILAVLLGLLAVLVLCVLFLPVRYRVQGSYHEKWEGKARISYLGPLIWLSISYAETFTYRLRICGITVRSEDKDKKSGTKRSRKSKREYNRDSMEEQSTDSSEKEEGTDVRYGGREPGEETGTSVNRQKERLSKEKSSGIADRIRSWKQTVKDRIHSFKEGGKEGFQMLRSLKETCEDANVKAGFGKLRAELCLLLKKIKPRHLKWYVRFGMEEPDRTGCVLAALGVIQGLWGRELYVKPEFEEKVFETEFQFRGFLQGIHLARLAWKLYFDKEIQYLVKKVILGNCETR